MDRLKELTKAQHKEAERQEFVKELMNGIDKERYAIYLYSQYWVYSYLEYAAKQNGIFEDFPEIPRAERILDDFHELWEHKHKPDILPTASNYMKYLWDIKDDPKKLLAHVYVRHFGDMSGGQYIAKCVPGAGRYYQFDGDVIDIKSRFREKLDDELADEANVCFNFATELFKDMMNLPGNDHV